MKDCVINKLKRAYPFIYKISGRYYCIGISVYYECDVEEKEAFNKLMESFRELMCLGYEPEDMDVEDLCKQYISIFGNRGDHAYNSRERVCVNRKIEELISQLNDFDLLELKNQMDERLVILSYVDRFNLNKKNIVRRNLI